jgi:two-component system, chemotaxis family, sensor kinase CheA
MLTTEKYKKLFLIEAEEKVLALNKALLGLEKRKGDVQLANDAMRAAHTLKSSAAAMSYMNISHLAHAMESLFEAVRTKTHNLETREIDVLFESVDALGRSLANIRNFKSEVKTEKLVNKIYSHVGKTKDQKLGVANKDTGADSTLSSDPYTVAATTSIRVDVDILDRLMNLTEELLVEKLKLGELVRNAEKNNDHNVRELRTMSEQFNRLLGDLQYNVTESRMVPIGQISERFPRMIRDLAKGAKKDVVFVSQGQDIELDRTVIDRLGEPLVHLLRNAVDHGIRGKGTVTLSAERKQDRVVIEVSNDGNSIDWEKIVGVAVNRGIIGEAEGKNLIPKTHNLNTPEELEALIYHPQLSTKQEVTETSGRGIGLSIVKSVMESLGGSVRLESPIHESSEGTKFILELPLTIAIIQALLVKSSDQIFALPFSQVDRSVRVSRENIKKMFDQEVAVVGEDDIPMVRLNRKFNLLANERESTSLFLSEEELKKNNYVLHAELMVIANKGDQQTGIVVDEILSEQDIVVKPLKGILKQSKGFAGVTLLGDGRPALILDIATLI